MHKNAEKTVNLYYSQALAVQWDEKFKEVKDVINSSRLEMCANFNGKGQSLSYC